MQVSSEHIYQVTDHYLSFSLYRMHVLETEVSHFCHKILESTSESNSSFLTVCCSPSPSISTSASGMLRADSVTSDADLAFLACGCPRAPACCCLCPVPPVA